MLGLIVHTQAAVQLHPFDPLLNIVGGLALGRLWKGDSSPSFLKKKKKKGSAAGPVSSLRALLPSLTFGAQFPECPIPPCLPSVGSCSLTTRMV